MNTKNKLKEENPENAEIYEKNTNDYIEKLNNLKEEYDKELKELNGAKALSLNESFSYIERDVGLDTIEIHTDHEESTISADKLKEIIEKMKAKPKERISIIHNHRVLILNDIRRTFVDIMEDLNACCSSLTMDDLLYCILVILHCPKEIIMDVMNTTSDAIKTRKNRIKNKMDKELFEKVFMSDNV